MQKYKEIESLEEFFEEIPEGTVASRYAFQAVNFTLPAFDEQKYSFRDCVFLGCEIPPRMHFAIGPECVVLSRIPMPFKVFPKELYSADTLYRGYDYRHPETIDTCYDTIVFQHYLSAGKYSEDIKETLTRSLHDHSINDALDDFLSRYDRKDIVAVMGGHILSRASAEYHKIAHLSRILTEKGKLMVSGGGPGAMEAVHLGAWMAGRTTDELEDAVSILEQHPTFNDKGWLPSAFYVKGLYPQRSGFCSLGIPTYLYGHEPSSPFSTHIAKFFDNSVREDRIVSKPAGGIIFAPGGPGTFQEIFQNAALNHYQTLGYSSPMVFLGKEYYTKKVPVYPILTELMEKEVFKNLKLTISDDVDEIVGTIMSYAG